MGVHALNASPIETSKGEETAQVRVRPPRNYEEKDANPANQAPRETTGGLPNAAPPAAPTPHTAFVRPRPGRPSKLTPDLTARLCQKLRAGLYLETASAMEGLSKNTLYDWLKRGARYRAALEAAPGAGELDPADEAYAEFSDAVEQALAEGDAFDETAISQAVRGGAWKAAAWRQERKHPDRWGRRDRLQVEAATQIRVEMWSPGEGDT